MSYPCVECQAAVHLGAMQRPADKVKTLCAPLDRIVRHTLAVGGAVGVACRPAMSIGSLSVIRSPEARFSN